MTRRPASRRPRKLDDVVAPTRAAPKPRKPRTVTPRQQLTGAKVTGTHSTLGATELLSIMRRVRSGDPTLWFGLTPSPHLDIDMVRDAARREWGWRDDQASASIDPDTTTASMTRAAERIADVARRGGRIAFATGRPSSLLPLYRALLERARAAGAQILTESQSGAFRADGRSGRRLYWYDGVAAVSDGESLVATAGIEASEEWLFLLPRPDLVVADVGFAAGGIRDELETIAFADLDAVALGIVAHAIDRGERDGGPTTIVPLDDQRPPTAYEPLLQWADPAFAAVARPA